MAAKTRQKEEAAEPVLVRATSKFVRVSPRKARLIADQVRGRHGNGPPGSGRGARTGGGNQLGRGGGNLIIEPDHQTERIGRMRAKDPLSTSDQATAREKRV